MTRKKKVVLGTLVGLLLILVAIASSLKPLFRAYYSSRYRTLRCETISPHFPAPASFEPLYALFVMRAIRDGMEFRDVARLIGRPDEIRESADGYWVCQWNAMEMTEPGDFKSYDRFEIWFDQSEKAVFVPHLVDVQEDSGRIVRHMQYRRSNELGHLIDGLRADTPEARREAWTELRVKFHIPDHFAQKFDAEAPIGEMKTVVDSLTDWAFSADLQWPTEQ